MVKKLPYEAKSDGVVQKNPVEIERTEHGQTFELGFPACKVSEYVDPLKGAKAIANLMNIGDAVHTAYITRDLPWKRGELRTKIAEKIGGYIFNVEPQPEDTTQLIVSRAGAIAIAEDILELILNEAGVQC